MAQTEPATEPVTEATMATEAVEETVEQTEETQAAMTEPEWLRETEPAEEEKETKKSFGGIQVGLIIVSAIFSLILIGALVFHRRSY